MINWAKFEDPFAIESAGFSDIVYPLTQATLKQVDTVDHAAYLLRSDMLHNADDRRFALAQSSTARHSYNFRSNKVRQMECAVDTLSNYIRQREALYYEHSSTDGGEDDEIEPVRAETDQANLHQDLSGITTASIPQDQLSECQLSPSTPRHISLPPPSPRHVRGHSLRPGAVISRSTPAPSSTSYIDARSVQVPISTAPTSICHGLSIADLIHPSPEVFTAAKGFLPPLTPDLEVDRASQELHSPDPNFLQATLNYIRADREVGKYRTVPPPSYPRAKSLAQAVGRGRNLKLPRMRRSSKSRDHGGKRSPHQPATSEAEPELESSKIPSSPRRGEHRNTQKPTSRPSKEVKSFMPYEPSAAIPSEQKSLDASWNTQRELHHCDEDDEFDTMPAPTPKPLIYTNATTRSKSMAPRNSHSASPSPRYQAVRTHKSIEVDEAEDLYAYALPGASPRSPSATTRTYRYGYIAGDVPGAREGKLRIRAPARERTRSKDGKSHGQPRAVSGVKRRRDSEDRGTTPEPGRSPGPLQQQLEDRPERKRQLIARGSSGSEDEAEPHRSDGQGTTALAAGKFSDSKAISDDEEVDQELIREAQRISERWWKEPLVPSKPGWQG